EASRGSSGGTGTARPTQHSWLQSHRARISQQISKELRMRTGAENLYRATSNDRVRETVALELSYVNSNLQLLKEELEGLSSGPDTHQPEGEGVTVPMIPLGLKETTELDWATPLKELISGHFGEDGASYEAEIRELEDLRQAMRTPSRDDAGLKLLAAYYSQLCFLEGRFFSPARSLGLIFHCRGPWRLRRAACCSTSGPSTHRSGHARTAPVRLLRENFSQAPSPDMSTTCLSTLERLMATQAQECVFEGLSLPALAGPHDCLAQLHLAQEAAQVAAEYRLVHQAMAQPPVQDYVPASWTTLVHVKAEHFHALAHYHAATALCDGSLAAEGELPAYEQVFQPPTPGEPHSPTLPQQPEERRNLAKAHLKRAILGQEEALRLHASCRVLRKVDLLQAVVAQALRHSLAKYSELEREDDFFEAAEAPDIQPSDPCLLQGPLPVFSAKNRWQLVGPIHLTRGEGGFGFTLRGDSPVLIAAVVPGGQAAAAGLQQGDYIVSVNGQPCKWWRHADVVAQLREAGAAGVSLQVASLLPRHEPRTLLGPGRRPRSQRACGFEMPAPTRASPQPLLVWSRRAKQGKPGGRPPPCTGGDCGTCP
uniref:Rhophilin Rho GTPase binding protein 1 n=1 Tax=Marmota marmota marmota TaxID=9994 RepID=A0A8C5Z1R6_MARMA